MSTPFTITVSVAFAVVLIMLALLALAVRKTWDKACDAQSRSAEVRVRAEHAVYLSAEARAGMSAVARQVNGLDREHQAFRSPAAWPVGTFARDVNGNLAVKANARVPFWRYTDTGRFVPSRTVATLALASLPKGK